MVMRIGINGFGRIGRMVVRIGIADPALDFVAINDLTDVKTLAHLFKYDSVHGKFDGEVKVDGNFLVINNKKIQVLAEKEPDKLPWGNLKIDAVVESTGRFVTKEGAELHLKAGAKKVIISAPAKSDGVKTIVKGVNEHTYNRATDNVLSMGSCTTNCMAPVVKVLNDNYKVKNGFMVTAHAYTATQVLVDGPSKDLRDTRGAAINIIPSTSGAAISVAEVIPELKGHLHSNAMRVPVPDGSVIYLVCECEKSPSKDEVNTLFKNVAGFHLKGILEYSEEPLVSSDIVGNPHSAIFDSKLTEVDGHTVNVVAWYDNEWGYSCRMCDVLKLL